MKEVAIAMSAVTGGSGDRPATEYHLVYHELAIVFTECPVWRVIARIGGVRAAGPLPDMALAVM